MNSIPAKQSPQRSPWDWTRARQPMHTGGSNKSAAAPSATRHASLRGGCIWLIDMTRMIQRRRAAREAS